MTNTTQWVNAYLTVTDVDKAIQFYQHTFGFELREKSPGDDGTTWHAEMLYHGQLIMFGKQGAYKGITKSPSISKIPSPITLYLYTENVDDFYKHALAKGAEGVIEPADMFWGDRMCQIKDEDDYSWCFATRGHEHK